MPNQPIFHHDKNVDRWGIGTYVQCISTGPHVQAVLFPSSTIDSDSDASQQLPTISPRPLVGNGVDFAMGNLVNPLQDCLSPSVCSLEILSTKNIYVNPEEKRYVKF